MIQTLKTRPHISIVTPVYGCRDCLADMYQRLTTVLDKINPHFEIIMVNDASPDDAWSSIVELCRNDKRVKGINFSRNFGQHYAISAGLHEATGDWVVVMDCDLQDMPEEIIKLYEKAREGFEVVFARRTERQDNQFKKFSSRCFWAVFDFFTDQKSDPSIANFSIISQKVVESFCEFSEQNRSYVLFIRWLGFKTTEISIEHSQRQAGKSSYSFSKLAYLALDGIVSHSNKPLRLSIAFGFVMAFLALIFACKLLIDFLFFAQPVAGWTSVMVSIYFLSGVLMVNMGLLGLYIGKIFNETKGRPLYVIENRVGFNSEGGNAFDADFQSLAFDADKVPNSEPV